MAARDPEFRNLQLTRGVMKAHKAGGSGWRWLAAAVVLPPCVAWVLYHVLPLLRALPLVLTVLLLTGCQAQGGPSFVIGLLYEVAALGFGWWLGGLRHSDDEDAEELDWETATMPVSEVPNEFAWWQLLLLSALLLGLVVALCFWVAPFGEQAVRWWKGVGL